MQMFDSANNVMRCAVFTVHFFEQDLLARAPGA